MSKGVPVYITNLTKRYSKVVAVKNVSLNIEPGEFIVILGPSGSGKSTLLRCIAGLEKPDTGEIIIDDRVVYSSSRKINIPPRERDVAMVFQDYALYPHMKVFDNIAFPLKLRKLPKTEIRRKVLEVARLLRIEELLDRYPRQLSGGQQQRVALARALVREPKLFLMDEPLSNLDAKLRLMMRAELKKLQKSIGVTTIYVTHDQAEAMSMGDRIVVLNNGEIQQIGTPLELYEKPVNMFVGGFLGTPPMNFFNATIVKHKQKLLFDCTEFTLTIPASMKESLEKHVGKEVIIGIRPEDFEIVNIQTENTIKAHVLTIEPLGSETVLNLQKGDLIFKVKTLSRYVGRVEEIIVRPIEKKIHVFHKKSGKRLL